MGDEAKETHLLAAPPVVVYALLPAPDFPVVHVGPTVAGLTGYRPEDFAADPRLAAKMVHPEDLGAYRAALARTLASGEGRVDCRMLTRAGVLRWFHHEFHLVRDGQGGPREILGSMVDVTPAQEAERTPSRAAGPGLPAGAAATSEASDRLQRSEQRFRDFAEAASDWLWELDAQLRISHLSERIEDLMGVERHRLLGRRRQDIAAEDVDALKWREHMAAIARREPFRAFEYRFLRTDGAVRYVRTSGKPFFAEDGTFLGYRGTATDVTALKQQEEALRRSEERYALAVGGAEVGIWDYDVLSGTVFWSPAFKEIVGLRPDDEPVLNDTFESLLDVDCRGRLRAALAAHLGEDEPFDLALRIRRPDGGTRWVQIKGQALRDGGGRPTRMAGSLVDITERVLAMERLRESERRFHDFAQAASDWFWEMDADLRLTYLSDRMAEATGVQPADLLGRTREEIAAERRTDPKWQAHLGDMRARRPFRDFEYAYRRVDGAVLQFRISGVPVFSGEGAFLGYRGTGANVTEHRRAEARARRAEQVLADAVESLADGFILLDPEQRFVMCNSRYREYYRGVSALLVPGTSFPEIVRRCALNGFVTSIGDLDAELRERFDPECRSFNKEEQLSDGRWIRISDHRTNDGGRVGIRTEITMQKEQQEALRKARDVAEAASNAKSAFLASVSHELRTPLNAIIGFSDLLATEPWGPLGHERYREYVQDIHGSGKLLLDLINNILDVARIEAGRYELREETIDLGDAIRQVARLARQAVGSDRHQLDIAVPDPAPAVRADPRGIRQILLNLLGNAFKFTPDGGRISVVVTTPDGAVEVAISDTGIGIPTDRLPELAQPFAQIDSVLSRRHSGSGLGLYISKA
ncbi:PAS domain S-box protein, partial [Arenibaculum sp.]|uniref:PAS domain S-box protein n=1 Tax=Arenibaculum sp. TaxID=2865862 RepID=UPI002E159D17|nr:PAS domain S-box protein [Arenibaculum sp.]